MAGGSGAAVTPAEPAKVFRDALGPSWVNDADKPFFHVMPKSGWLNDPNGPIYHDGKYHVFFQHVPGSAEWAFGIVWGHAVSSDLVTWKHEPHAIAPTPNSYDEDGCWSGNTVIDTDGTPTILYTGVRRHSSKSLVPLPPKEKDLNLPQIEAQCSARASASDTALLDWETVKEPVIRWPPTQLGKLTGFRDPFVIKRKHGNSPWELIVGSGIANDPDHGGKSHGIILLYHSQSLTEGWKLQGTLEDGLSKECQDGKHFDLGEMWECPFFTQLKDYDSNKDTQTWMLCVSPYPHKVPEIINKQPTNPVLYWLGNYSSGKFQMKSAPGPKLLDLGDVAYAPTIFRDGKDRCLMFFWLQELRPGAGADYSGCLSVPRMLTLKDNCLRQEPVPEIDLLRTGQSVETSKIEIDTDSAVLIPGTEPQAFDVSLTLVREQAAQSGILLRAWLRPSQEDGSVTTQALLVDWENSTLEVVTTNELNPEKLTFSLTSITKRIGGPIRMEDNRLGLRLLIDHSCVEVFTQCGQSLSTRMYRAGPPAGAKYGFHALAFGSNTRAESVAAYGMTSIWKSDSIS